MNSMFSQTFGRDQHAQSSEALTAGEYRRGPRPLAGKVGRVSTPSSQRPELWEGDPSQARLPAGKPSEVRMVSSWHELEAQSDRPEVQDLIREGIRTGTIRVGIRPGGGIRILAIDDPPASPATNQTAGSRSAAAAAGAGEADRSSPPARAERGAGSRDRRLVSSPRPPTRPDSE
jgi:hypothetical protein